MLRNRIEGWIDGRLVWLAERGLIGCHHEGGVGWDDGWFKQFRHYLGSFSLQPANIYRRVKHWNLERDHDAA